MTSRKTVGWGRLNFLRIPFYLPLFAIQFGLLVAKSTNDLTKSAYKGTKKRVRRVQRRRNNKRAATYDIATQIPKPNVTQRNQNESGFLKLPLEIRQQIYDLYYEPAKVILNDLDGYRLSSTALLQSQLPPGFPITPKIYVGGCSTTRNLCLSLVCRQIFCDTIDYPYRRDTFTIPSHLALHLPSLAIFPQRHLEMLRSIELSFCFDFLGRELKTARIKAAPYCERAINPWATRLPGRFKKRDRWIRLWKCLAALPQLERLRIQFIWLPGPKALEDQEQLWLMAPLLQFKRQRPLVQFDVLTAKPLPESVSPGWNKAIPYQVEIRPEIASAWNLTSPARFI